MERFHVINVRNGISMQITKLNVYTFDSPFKTPIKTNLISMNIRKVLVIGAEIDGVEYFAEANSFETPWYHHETIDSVHRSVVQMFKNMKGKSFDSMDAFASFLDPNQPNASACLDVIAYQYFNALQPVSIPIGQTLHHNVNQHNASAARIKIKMHDNILAQVEAIRQSSDVPIVIDANGLLNAAHFDLLHALSQFNILYFEEPFKDIQDYAMMHQRFPNVRLAIDESATDEHTIKQYYDAGVTTAVIKYSRVGGITKAKALQSRLSHMQFVSGGMYEFGLSKYFTAMLGEEFQTVPDVTPKGTYFDDDFTQYQEVQQENLLHISVPKVNRAQLQFVATYN